MSRILVTAGIAAGLLLTGCATPPLGPTALVMPASGKPFEVFAQDQFMCKQFASSEVDGGASVANMKEFGTAALSTALGAGMGAAIHGRRGAEIGGGLGAIAGFASVANGSARDQNGLQGRYNLAYTQCMYAHGNQIAGIGGGPPRVASGGPGYPQPPGVRGPAYGPAGYPQPPSYGPVR